MNLTMRITMSLAQNDPDRARRDWMALLARADETTLSQAWDSLDSHPEPAWVRRPETGMTMVRGRAGGTGQAFNLGEMTVTRCALRISEKVMGVAYVKGRCHRHAELAALFDALLQLPDRRQEIERKVIRPLRQKQDDATAAARARTAATRVEFFTMATGREGT